MRWFSSSPVDDDDDSEGGLDDLLVETLPTEGEWAECTRQFLPPLQVPVRGSGKYTSDLDCTCTHQFKNFSSKIHNARFIHKDILTSPLFNKGTAFKSGERDRLRFRGLLPPRRINMGIQKTRILKTLRDEESPIRKNIILEDLHDRNETLYHRVLVDHIEEMAPLIYTPTGESSFASYDSSF